MAIDPSLLQQLLGRHPARRMAFDELRAGLLRGVSAKHINISRDGPLELFGYSSACQFEQEWDLFSLVARGLILDATDRQVIATPFPKFFNFNEGAIALPDEPFEVTEKIDGSLGILFHHNGQWRISTRGQLASIQGQWATAHLHRAVNLAALEPGTTYLVEIVYRENQVVIAYDFEGLVLLAGYNQQGDELSRGQIEAVAAAAGLRVAPSAAFASFGELLSAAGALTRHEEGFVLRYRSGLRIKLKGEAYCRVHKLICRCTPLALWEAMRNLDDLDAMRRDLPEEMRRDFDTIRQLLAARFDELLAEIRAGHERMAHCNDKELGLLRQDPASPLTAAQRSFVFACRHKDFLQKVHERGEWREKLFRLLRPERNRLAGYVPSNAMTRFQEESG